MEKAHGFSIPITFWQIAMGSNYFLPFFMSRIFTLIFIACSTVVFAQRDTTIVFYDEQDRPLPSADASAFSYRIAVRVGNVYHLRHYLTSNDLLVQEGLFNRKKWGWEHHGFYRSWHKNGQVEIEGNYDQDRRTGLWKEYYANGRPAHIGYYSSNAVYCYQHWDEDGNPMLVNGTGKYITKLSETVIHKEVVDSVVIASYYVDRVQLDTIYSHAEQPARYKNGMEDLFNDISKDLKYPKEIRKNFVRGRLFVAFKIDKKGKPYDFKVRDGIGMGCDEAAVFAIQRRSVWTPAKVRGKPVIQEMILPVSFNLRMQ